MPSQGTTLSVRTPRRSRSPALALNRVSGTPLDRKVDPTPDRARIQVSCLHKLVGIAPFVPNVGGKAASNMIRATRRVKTDQTAFHCCRQPFVGLKANALPVSDGR